MKRILTIALLACALLGCNSDKSNDVVVTQPTTQATTTAPVGKGNIPPQAMSNVPPQARANMGGN